MKKIKLDPKRVVYSSSLENIASLTLAGAGIGVLPTRVVKEFGAKLYRVKNTPVFKDELYIVYRYENKNLKIVSEIVKCMKNEFL